MPRKLRLHLTPHGVPSRRSGSRRPSIGASQRWTARGRRYSGRTEHPQHALAAREMRGFGAGLIFEVADAASAVASDR